MSCAGKIVGAVSKIPGVKSVDPNPGTKLVSVVIDNADPNAVMQAIIDAGYEPIPK